jgi:hypothetical protein
MSGYSGHRDPETPVPDKLRMSNSYPETPDDCPDTPDEPDSPDKYGFVQEGCFLVVGLILMAFEGSLEHNYHINNCGSKSLLIVRCSYTQFQNKI